MASKETKPVMIRISKEAAEHFQKKADADDRKLAYVLAKVIEKEYLNQTGKSDKTIPGGWV